MNTEEVEIGESVVKKAVCDSCHLDVACLVYESEPEEYSVVTYSSQLCRDCIDDAFHAYMGTQ
jgi:hypothetical protein